MPPPSSSSDAQFVALVNAQDAVRVRLTKQAVAAAEQSARSFTGWYDTDQITTWSTKVSSLIESIQRNLAQSTDAYLARVTSGMLGKTVRPVGRVDISTLRSGITHPGAYARAADVYRYQQSRFDLIGKQLATATDLAGLDIINPELTDPVEAAVQRVMKVADMDAQLAVRGQSHRFMTDSSAARVITGYRRVIHPERSLHGSCGLCIAASDRLYGPNELLPIHGLCKCTTAPVLDGKDPGSTLNQGDLKKVYSDAGDTTAGEKLKRTRYKVNEHGELGPVLDDAGKPFRSRQTAASDTRKLGAAMTPERRLQSIQRALDGQRGALPRAHELAAANPKKWGPYLGALEVRVKELSDQLAA